MTKPKSTKKMKTLEIEIPEGYKIDKENSTFEKIVFKPIKESLPKRWEDLKLVNGYYVNDTSNVLPSRGFGAEKHNQNTFVTEEQARASIALAKLSQLRDVYRQGWVPDYTNETTEKYGINYMESEATIGVWLTREHFLSFQSKEIALEFLKNFRDLIEQARPLMS